MWDPSCRPSAKECLEHPYFATLRKAVTHIDRKAELDSVTNYIGPNNSEAFQLMR